MRGLIGVGPLAWERLVANWRLLSVLALGILMAATLMAATPVYTRVMNDLGLDFSLKQQLRSASRNTIIQFGLPLGSEEGARERLALTRLMAEKLSWLTAEEARFGALPDLTLAGEGEAPSTDRFRTLLTLETQTGLENHTRLVEGRYARPTADPAAIEVVMPVEAATFLRLKPGDRISATHQFDDCNRPPPTDDPAELRDRARFRCVPQSFVTLSAGMTVVGFVEQSNPDEAFWSAGRITFARPAATDEGGAIVPVLLPEETFHQALARRFPGLRSEFRVTNLVAVERLNSANLDRARSNLKELRDAVNSRHGLADLPTEAALNDFNRRASFNQVPLLLLLLQVVGIALYYVVLVASMLVDKRSEEIAMLRSRGASVMQVVATGAVEACILALGSAAVAPFLAAAAIALLGKTGTFEQVSGGKTLPFVVLPQAFAFALAGAMLAVFAVLIPTFFAARRGIVQYLQGAARPGTSLLQRYYIDVGLAGLAALTLWELNQRGSVFDPRSVGGWSADPLLLLSPLVLIAAIGALMFRVLPLVLGLISRLMSLTSGPGVTLGLWQLTRSPSRYTQLALLVVMAGAVGTFAATYGETTDRSQEDRALFEAGVDLRITSLARLQGSTPTEIATALESVDGVEEAAAAYRGSLTLGPLPGFGTAVPVLGIDPRKAADLVWFREDFASEDETALLRRIIGSPTGGTGLPLPGEPVAVSVWVAPSQPRETSTLWLRTLDANGVFHLHELGVIDFVGYRQLTARVVGTLDDVKFPASIMGFVVTQPVGVTDSSRGSLFVDDIGIVDADGHETVLEDFEGPFRWDALRTATRTRDTLTQVNQGQRRGNAGAQYTFRIGTSVPFRGMYVSDANVPLPAIASERFLQRVGGRVGSEVELVIGSMIVPLKISGTTTLFPMMPDSSEGFLIVNQEHLYFFAGLTNQTVARGPNEAWLKASSDEGTRGEAIKALGERFGIVNRSIVDQQKVLKDVRSDPVVRAGGSGILLVSLIAAFLLLGLGFGLTLYVGGQIRTVEVSVMRAVGFSRAQLIAMVCLEYLVVAAVGLAIGTVAGLRISDTMLSFLNVTAQGARIVPPFALATRWDTVGIAFTVIGVAFIAGIAALAIYFLRLPVSRILRLTR